MVGHVRLGTILVASIWITAVQAQLIFSVREEQPIGTPVGTIDGIDNTYSLSETPFFLLTDAENLITNNVIDREALDNDVIKITIVSSDPGKAPVEASVNILDINDNDPRFPLSPLNLNLTESTASDVKHILPSAVDADIGENAVVTSYVIVSGDTDIFQVTQETESDRTLLFLNLLQPLNRENGARYDLNISATDSGGRRGYLHLIVNVQDINDNPPKFDQREYRRSFPEDTPVGSVLFAVHAVDLDLNENGEVTYSLTSRTEPETFRINATSGEIILDRSLDYEDEDLRSHSLDVTATDGGSPAMTDNAFVTIDVTNVNDNDPEISFRYVPQSASIASVSEEMAVGSLVALVSASDPDETDGARSVPLQIVSGNDRGRFELVELFTNVAKIQIADNTSLAQNPTYNLTVRADDADPNSDRYSLESMLVLVNSDNDHPPVFDDESGNEVFISETAPVGSVVTSVHASDLDAGISGRLVYEIVGGDNVDWFAIDTRSGLITTAERLRFEENSANGTVILRVSAKDETLSPLLDETEITIMIYDENDNPPVFEERSYSFSKEENSVGRIGRVAANDNDYGANGEVLYHLESAQCYSPVTNEQETMWLSYFSVSQDQGEVTVARALDRERTASCTLIIAASDRGNPTMSSYVDVTVEITNIDDNNPIFYPLHYFAHASPDTPIGSVISTLRARDPDSSGGNCEECSFSESSSSFNSYYDVNSVTGDVTLTRSLSALEPTVHVVKYSVTDVAGKPSPAQAVVTISIRSTGPTATFKKDVYTFEVLENAEDDYQVGAIEGKDFTPVNFVITNGDDKGVFEIGSSDGIIKVAQPDQLSADGVVSYTLTIFATVAENTAAVTVTGYVNCTAIINIIDVNDKYPSFSELSSTAVQDGEQSYNDSVMITLTDSTAEIYIYNANALDLDIGENSEVFYELASSYHNTRIDGTGKIYIRPVTSLTTLSTCVEYQETFDVIVNACDKGAPRLCSTLYLNVTLVLADKMLSVTTPNIYLVLPENLPLNSRVATVETFDEFVNTGIVNVSYELSPPNGHFAVFPGGEILSVGELDFEVENHFELTLHTTISIDGKQWKRYSIVSVDVVDRNDNKPTPAPNSYEFSVKEAAQPGGTIGTLSVQDADSGLYSSLEYKVDATNLPSSILFYCDRNEGSLHPTGSLRREILAKFGVESPTMPLNVIISDQSGLTSPGSEVNAITVTTNIVFDMIDLYPLRFEPSFYHAEVMENAAQSDILTVFARDHDSPWSIKDMNYEIYDTDNESQDIPFHIDQVTGTISLKSAAALDREEREIYHLTAMARYSDGSDFASATVVIRVLDEKDSPPVFRENAFRFSVPESSPVMSVIGRVLASDGDETTGTSTLSYGLETGTSTFAVDSETGYLYLAAAVDYESQAEYNITVKVTDEDGESSTTYILISVLDTNDNIPIFIEKSTSAITEGFYESPIEVARVKATDKDSERFSTIRYELVHSEPTGFSSPTGPQLRVGETTGAVTVTGVVDREASGTLEVSVRAYDTAQPSVEGRFSDATLSIEVVDKNDNKPIFINPPATLLSRQNAKQNGHCVMTLAAVDPDEGANGEVSFSLEDDGANSDLFSINDGGCLIVTSPLVSGNGIHTVVIVATDKGIPPLSTRMTFDVIVGDTTARNGPSFRIATNPVILSEGSRPGSVTTLSTVSSRASQVRYYMTKRPTNPDEKALKPPFAIASTSGTVSLEGGLSGYGGRDYSMEAIAVELSPTELQPRISKTQLTIRIEDENDHAPTFDSDTMRVTISESSPQGTPITTVTATDDDVNDDVTYSLLDEDGNEPVAFTIDPVTGHISVSQDGVDREDNALQKLRVVANDGIHRSSTEVLVSVRDVNDNPPTFDSDTLCYDIAENSPPKTVVGRLVATDSDTDSTITYTLLEDPYNEMFKIHENLGVIVFNADIASLDREITDLYILKIRATDQGGLFSDVRVLIHVADVNDHNPVFVMEDNSLIEVLENSTVGSFVAAVQATDADIGPNADVTYSIIGGDPNEQFFIDSYSGEIRLRKFLDREINEWHNLTIMSANIDSPYTNKKFTVSTLSVRVSDVNDNPPLFFIAPVIYLKEDAKIGDIAFPVTVIDLDQGRNGNFHVEMVQQTPEHDIFQLDSTGTSVVIKDPTRLDFEDTKEYNITLLAYDRGDVEMSSVTKVLVKIVDVNDHGPVFDEDSYSATVNENSVVGSFVTLVRAYDVDSGFNGEVRYSIQQSTSASYFYISKYTGDVFLANALDYELASELTLTVQATDGGVDQRSTSVGLVIMVIDNNDCAPTFKEDYSIITVKENEFSPGEVLMRLTAQDGDSGNNGIADIRGGVLSSPQSDAFGLEHISEGVTNLVLRKPLDREVSLQYQLTVNAADRGSPAKSGSASILVLVADENDNLSEFDQYQYYASVLEDIQPGSIVTTVSATDGDSSVITYKLDDESAYFPFYVNPTTGQVHTREFLDREMVAWYNLTVLAYDETDSDGTQNVISTQLYVTINDVNDNDPSFKHSEVTVYVNPTDTDNMLMVAEATDPDEMDNGRISYSIPESANFSIDPDTGAITILQPLVSPLTLQVSASDNGPEQRSSRLTVKVFFTNQERPEISSNVGDTLRLSENSDIGATIARFTAVTRRLDATPLLFTLKGDRFNWFSLSPTSGALTITGNIDNELTSNVVIWIEATDSGSPQLSSFSKLIVQVNDVNDNAPTFDDDVYVGHVREDEIITILTVSAKDPDEGVNREVTFTFVEELSDDVDNFVLDPEHGTIGNRVRLDREIKSSYKLVVRASDQGSPSLYRDITVHVIVDDVNDNPPVFTRLFSTSISEDAVIGSFVLQVTSTDEDENPNHRYELTSDSNGTFSIDENGNIVVAKLLDREINAIHILEVESNDDTWKPHTTVTIHVEDMNDNTPRFSATTCEASISEDTSIGTVILQLNANDADLGENGEVRYRIPGGHEYFDVDQTGEIATTAELQCISGCPMSFIFSVVACDGGVPNSRCSSCRVTVSVKPVNRNHPTFSQSDIAVAIQQTSEIGTEVYDLQAVDADPGTVIQYAILSNQDSSYFELISNNLVTTRKALSGKSVGDILQIRVKAVDDGVPAKSAFLDIDFEITHENAHSPVFGRSSYESVPVPEDSSVGRDVIELLATDADPGINGEVTYSITSGNDDSVFSIGKFSGMITLAKTLDYEQIGHYDLVVTASDLAVFNRNMSVNVRIPVLDVNDNPPEFNNTYFEVVVTESTALRTVVSTILATDADSGDNALISYSVENPASISVRPLTGELYVNNQLDYETQPVHILKIFAQNEGATERTKTTLIVYVTGENEFPPAFLQPSYEFDLPFSAAIGTKVGFVNASDDDSGPDGDVEYFFSPDSDSENFALHKLTGVITVAQSMSYSVGDIVNVQIIAKNPTSSSDVCLFDDVTTTINMISDECRLRPCQNGATCKDGLNAVTCICLPGYTGQFCNAEIDECAPDPCLNGACIDQVNGFTCTCNAGYTGDTCDVEIDFCAGQPCLNGGTCTDGESSYTCECTFGSTGTDCGTNSINFPQLSYMVVGGVSAQIEFDFSTVSTPSLLFFSFLDSSGYIAAEIIDDYLRLRVKSQNSTVKELVLSTDVTDGRWHHINFTISLSEITLQLDACSVTEESSCYGIEALSEILDLASSDLIFGGIRREEDLAEGHLSSHDFVGCIRSLKLDSRDVASPSSAEIKESSDVANGCDRTTAASLCSGDTCANEGFCTDLWESAQCDCSDRWEGRTCDTQKVGRGFPGTGYLTFQFSESFKRDAILETAAASTAARRRRSVGTISSSFEIRFRSTEPDGILVFFADGTGEYYAGLFVKSGVLGYEHKVVDSTLEMQLTNNVTDGEWHTAKVEIVQIDDVNADVTLRLDSKESVEGFSRNENVIDDFADPLVVKSIFIGGKPSETVADFTPSKSFKGCIFDLKLNDETYPLSSDVTNYKMTVIAGDAGISVGCGDSAAPCKDIFCDDDKICDANTAACVCQPGYDEVDGKCAGVSPAGGLTWWIIVLIVLFSVLFVAGALVFAICVKRKGIWKSLRKAKENGASNSNYEFQSRTKRDTPDLVPDDVYIVPNDSPAVRRTPKQNGSLANSSIYDTLSPSTERNGNLPGMNGQIPAENGRKTPNGFSSAHESTMTDLPKTVERPASAQPNLMPTPSPIMMSSFRDMTSPRRSKTPNGALYAKQAKTLPRNYHEDYPLSYLYQKSQPSSRSTSRNSSRIHSMPRNSHQRRRHKIKSQSETLEGMMRELSGIAGLTNEELDLLNLGVRALENGHDTVLYDDATSVSTSSLTDLSMQSRTTSSSARVRSFVRSASPHKDSLMRERIPNAVVNASLQTLSRASPIRKEHRGPTGPIAASAPFEFSPPPSDFITSASSSDSGSDGDGQEWDSDASDTTAISTIKQANSSTASSSGSSSKASKLDLNFPTSAEEYFSSLVDVFDDLSELKSDGSHRYQSQGRRVSAYPGFVGHEISMWSEIEKLSKRPLKKLAKEDSVLASISQSSLDTDGEKREKMSTGKNSRSSTPSRQHGGLTVARDKRKEKQRVTSPSPKNGDRHAFEVATKKGDSAMRDRRGELNTSTSSSNKSGRNSRRAEFVKYI